MNKYHCYEKGTEYYITTLYSYTDVLNLQLFLQEKGTNLFTSSVKLSKKEVKKVFGEVELSNE